MLFSSTIYQFQCLATRSEGLYPLSQEKTLVAVCSLLNVEENVHTAVLDHPVNTDDTLRYLLYLMFDSLHSRILNCNFYSEGEELSELLQYILRRSQLSQVLQNSPDSEVTEFEDTRLLRPTPNVIELRKYGMLLNQPPQQVFPVTAMYANCSSFILL